MKVRNSLIEEFYRAVASWGIASVRAKNAWNCLVRIGYASGFQGDEGNAGVQGMRVVAIQNTPDAATALAMYMMLLKGGTGTAGQFLGKMTTPAAKTAFDELVQKAWDAAARTELTELRQGRDWVLEQHRKPTARVFIDVMNHAKSPGYRIIRTVENAYWSPYGSNAPMLGWIKGR
jgi:hypothetical protein